MPLSPGIHEFFLRLFQRYKALVNDPRSWSRAHHRGGRILAGAIAVAAGLALAAASGVSHLNSPTGGQEQTIRIQAGMSARHIGEKLAQHGLIRSALLFEWTARIRGLAAELEAGTYQVSGGETTAAILEDLLRAPLEMVRVTLPEGMTRHQTAQLLQRQGLADSSRFMALTEDTTLLRQLRVEAENLEGYLYPETYFLDHHATEEEIIRRIVAEFFSAFSDSLYVRLDSVGLSLHQVVTLASIVEREAVVAQERPVIASIFYRRLHFNRRLESCATVEFALGVHKKRLTNADLKVVSPYNTYAHRGLPPGPIGSPGRASIVAALYPAQTEYLYFVARGDGTHSFSRTNREHEAAKRAVKREERRRRTRTN